MPPIKRPSTNPLRSALPGPIRGLTDMVFPPDELPMPGGVTIGPKAIPLADEDTYFKQIISKVLSDFASVGDRYLDRAGGAPGEGVNTIMNAAGSSPGMSKIIARQMMTPEASREALTHQAFSAPDMKETLKPMIDVLAGIMAGIPPK